MSSSDEARRRRRKNRPTGRGRQDADSAWNTSREGRDTRREDRDTRREGRDTRRDAARSRDADRSDYRRRTSRNAAHPTPSAFDDPLPRPSEPYRRERAETERNRRDTRNRPEREDRRDTRRSSRNRQSGAGAYNADTYRTGGGYYGDEYAVYAGEGGVAETRIPVSRRNADTDFTPRRRQRPGKYLKRRRRSFLLVPLIIIAVLLAGNHFLFREPEQQTERVYTPEEEAERPPVSTVSVIPEEIRNLEVRENLEDEGLDWDDGDSTPEMETPVQEDGRKTRKEHFYTFLLAGTDDNNGGSDTIILAALDAGEKRITGLSLPRDTKIYVNDTARKLNYAYRVGGMSLLTRTVSRQLGIPIDYTVEVDLQGFAALVDAIGGVDFDVPIDMDYDDPTQDLYIGFHKGMQHLNGLDALKVVRFRHNWDGTGYGDEDLGRMRTQQNFLKAVAKKLLRPGNLTKVGKFVNIFQQYVKTDLTAAHMAWLGREAILIGADGVNLSTLPGEWKSPYIYLDQKKILEILNEKLNPYEEPITAKDLRLAK